MAEFAYLKRFPYKAMDRDGRWNAFKRRPFILGENWTTGDDSERLYLQEYGSIEEINWRYSLEYHGPING